MTHIVLTFCILGLLMSPSAGWPEENGQLHLMKSLTSARKSGDLKVAESLAQQLVGLAPDDALYRHMLGELQLENAKKLERKELKIKKEAEAFENLRSAMRLKKRFRPAYDVMVAYLIENRIHHEARETLTDMVKEFKGQAGLAHADLCRLYAIDGYLQQAIEHCEKSIVQAPQALESYVYLAQAINDQGDTGRAEKTLIMAAKKFPNSSFVQTAVGKYFALKGLHLVASKHFKLACKDPSASADAHLGLAQSLFALGKHNESLEPFKRACALNPHNKEPFLTAATYLRLNGNVRLSDEFSRAAQVCAQR